MTDPINLNTNYCCIRTSTIAHNFGSFIGDNSKVFETLEDLPPIRGHKHKFFLNDNTQSICERPYKYPYFQKSKIEKIW